MILALFFGVNISFRAAGRDAADYLRISLRRGFLRHALLRERRFARRRRSRQPAMLSRLRVVPRRIPHAMPDQISVQHVKCKKVFRHYRCFCHRAISLAFLLRCRYSAL